MATTFAWITMDGATDRTDGGTDDEYAAGDRVEPEDPVLFDAVVVRYESGSDRCTLVPSEGTAEERLDAWLTADVEAVVDLDDCR